MIYFILYIVIALITTALLYWFLDDDDSEVLSVLGGVLFPLTIVFLFFCLPVFIINKIKNR